MGPKFEAIELEGDSVIKTFLVRCALLQENHPWHYHPECELTYIIKGEGTRFIGDNVQHFSPGDLIFASPNLPHCWTNDDSDNADPSRNELLVLQFKPEYLGSPPRLRNKRLKNRFAAAPSRLDCIGNDIRRESVTFVCIYGLILAVEAS